MSPKPLLREIERKAWLQTFEHGLWDVAVGLLWLSFGVSILTGFAWMTPIWVAVALPSLQQSMRRLIIPRIGHATFKTRRRRSITRITVILTILAALGAVMFFLVSWATQPDAPAAIAWLQSHMLAVIALIWGGALVVAGWAADFHRLYGYGLVLFGVLLGSDLGLPYRMGEALLGVGALITVIGVFLFLRFVWRHPRHEGALKEEPKEDA